MPASTSSSRVRPLIARPGARFVCAGDGVCCTDLHGVGPLQRREAQVFRAMHEDLVVRFAGHDLLRSGEAGRCPFAGDPASGETGCALHLRLGPRAKPRVCTRFPYGLVATPQGGRVTTSLRCSCRTLGERPLLSLADAEQSLRFPSGRLLADQRVGDEIELRSGRSVSFGVYVERESELLETLEQAPRPLDEIRKHAGRARLGREARRTRLEQGEALSTASLDTRFGAAVAWMGFAMRRHAGANPIERPPRPWSIHFDRAEARCAPPADASVATQLAQRVFADFAAESIWDLEWVGSRAFSGQLSQLGEQLELLEILLEELTGDGSRADRSAAEAVMILDLARLEDD